MTELRCPRCPRCAGWWYLEHDPEDGPIAVCLQCGWRETPTPLPFVQEQRGQQGHEARRPQHRRLKLD